MQELIKVTTDAQGARVVSARELYSFLEIQSNFTTWVDRMLEYGFEEGVDYLTSKTESQVPHQGGVRSIIVTDYILTLDMAKEIAMLRRSYRGKQARRYFIACEAALRNLTAAADRPTLRTGGSVLSGEGLLPVAVRFFDGFGGRCVLLSNEEVWYKLADLVGKHTERAVQRLGWGCKLLLNDTGRRTWYVSKAGWALLAQGRSGGMLSLFEKGGDAL